MFQDITVTELEGLIGKINLIDIRNKETFKEGNIYTSINVPKFDLLDNINKYLKEYERYYIYCGSGVNSKDICSFLSKRGFDVVNVIGGYSEWLKIR